MRAFLTIAHNAAFLLQGAARHRHCPCRTFIILGSIVFLREVLLTTEGRPSKLGAALRLNLPPFPTPSSSAYNCTQLVSVSEVTEGPYWIDENIAAKNLRLGLRYGVPLNLTIKVSNRTLSALYGSCVPIEQARVDLWQSRYDGRYSDEEAEGTAGETWLRGYQYSNSSGHASFLTIIPGWYVSRTPHIHIRIRIYEADGNTTSYDDTTQLYFNNTITTTIYKYVYPYNNRGRETQDTFNNNDSLFTSTNLLTLKGSYEELNGYSSFVEIKLPFDISLLPNYNGTVKNGGGIIASL